MATWLERNWDLLRETIWALPTEKVEEEPDYLDNDIGPVLYAIHPRGEQPEK